MVVVKDTDPHGYCLKSAQSDYAGDHYNDLLEFEKKQLDQLLLESQKIKESTKKAFHELESNFKSGNIIFVIGAGVSISCGLPSWKSLVEKLAYKIFEGRLFEMEIHSILNRLRNDMSLEGIVEGLSTFSSDEKINKAIRELLYDNGFVESKLLNLISKMIQKEFMYNCNNDKSTLILTFNYDNLLEQSLSYLNIPYIIETEIPLIINTKIITIVHIHGYISPNYAVKPKIILAESSYGQLYLKKSIDPLTYVIENKQIPFFIGFSFKDIFVRNVLHTQKLKMGKSCALTLFTTNDLFSENEVFTQPVKETFDFETINDSHGYRTSHYRQDLERLRNHFINDIPSILLKKQFNSIGLEYIELMNYEKMNEFLRSSFLKT